MAPFPNFTFSTIWPQMATKKGCCHFDKILGERMYFYIQNTWQKLEKLLPMFANSLSLVELHELPKLSCLSCLLGGQQWFCMPT